MNKKNLLTIGAGFVVSFIMAYVIYGVLLMNYMTSATMAGLNKPMQETVWWAVILGTLTGVVLMNYVLTLAGATNFKKGAQTVFWVGLLMSLTYALYFWGGTNMYTKIEMVCVDPIASGVSAAITGGVMGWVRGMVGKPAVAAAA